MKIIEFLKEEAAFNFNTKDRWGRTPLKEALELKNPEVLQLFAESMPPIDTQPKSDKAI